MGMKEKPMPDTAGVQVFELTMDNPEDQDELNRQLQKPAEPTKNSSAMGETKCQDHSRNVS